MKPMFRSATFKLTMWYLAIIVAISLLFSIVVYHYATIELARGLHRESERIYTLFPVFQNSPVLHALPDYDEAAHRLLLRLIGFNTLVFAAAGLASYLLARRTLSPIELAHLNQQRFTSDVSHELRTPLTALRMETEVALINKQASASELRTTMQSNLEEVAKLEGLINSLLRLTRLEEAELRNGFESVSSKAVITAAVDQLSTTAERHDVTFKAAIQDAQLYGDATNLGQLMVLIIDNAIKYSPAGSLIQLTDRLDAHYYHLIVQDHGIGIEPDALDHIFERFYRADSSRTKNGSEGYGLGLSIAKMIADVHGGTITLASEVGQGTVATISLPLAPASTSH